MKKYIAEAFGTFVLTFLVALSFSSPFPVSTPILAVLTVGLFVYAFWHISGGHINPAVTIGLWSIKKISSAEALKYIIAQFIGGGIACYIFLLTSGGTNIDLVLDNSVMVGVAELLGMLFYGFFIAAVVYGKTPNHFHGLIIAGALLLGITTSSLLGSNGLINPAVAFGIKSFNIMYLIGPLFGSVLGMQLYKYLDN